MIIAPPYTFADITKVGTESQGNLAATTTITVTKPTGVRLISTHRLVLAIGLGNSGVNPGTITAPAGWGTIANVLNANDGTNNVTGYVFHAPGDVAGLGFTCSVADTVGWIMSAFTGVDQLVPVIAGVGSSVNGASSILANGVTVNTPKSLWSYGWFDFLGDTVSATGFTAVENSPHTNETAALLYYSNPARQAPGPTGAQRLLSTSTTGQVLIAIPFALQPAKVPKPSTQRWFIPPPQPAGQVVDNLEWWVPTRVQYEYVDSFN